MELVFRGILPEFLCVFGRHTSCNPRCRDLFGSSGQNICGPKTGRPEGPSRKVYADQEWNQSLGIPFGRRRYTPGTTDGFASPWRDMAVDRVDNLYMHIWNISYYLVSHAIIQISKDDSHWNQMFVAPLWERYCLRRRMETRGTWWPVPRRNWTDLDLLARHTIRSSTLWYGQWDNSAIAWDVGGL